MNGDTHTSTPRLTDEIALFRDWFKAMVLPGQTVSKAICEIADRQIAMLEGMAAATDEELTLFRELMTDEQAKEIINRFSNDGSGSLQ